jgi:hypothetical protein
MSADARNTRAKPLARSFVELDVVVQPAVAGVELSLSEWSGG